MITRRTTCRTVRDMLPLHVGGDLDPRHVPAVDQHLGSCLGCAREFRELSGMRGLLGVLAEQPLPAGILDGFTTEVMARIAIGEPGPAAEAPRAGPRQTIFSLPRVAAAAAAVLVAIAGLRATDDSGVRASIDETAVTRMADTVNGGTYEDGLQRVRPGPGPVVGARAGSRPETRGASGVAPSDAAASQLPGLPLDAPLPSELEMLIRQRSGLVPLIAPPTGLELDDSRAPRERP